MKRTNQLTLLGAVLAVTFAVAVPAAEGDDSAFLQDAIRTDIAEVKMSELALQRSRDEGVREFAHRLQTDHSTSMQEATALAKTQGTTPPSQPTAEAQQQYAALANLSGQEFDAAFVNHMVAGHREAVGKFGEQTHANPNAAIADFATKMLPKLKEHLAMAESLLAAGVHPSAEAHGGHSDPRPDAGPPEARQAAPPKL